MINERYKFSLQLSMNTWYWSLGLEFVQKKGKFYGKIARKTSIVDYTTLATHLQQVTLPPGSSSPDLPTNDETPTTIHSHAATRGCFSRPSPSCADTWRIFWPPDFTVGVAGRRQSFPATFLLGLRPAAVPFSLFCVRMPMFTMVS